MARNDNLTLGLELEINTHAGSRTVRDALNSFGLNAWRIASDGSIGAGWELVSPVLFHDRAQEDLKALDSALASLRQSGESITASHRCGFHIHAAPEGREWTSEEMKMLLRRFVKYEDTFDVLQPSTRRGNLNTYCHSNAHVFTNPERYGRRQLFGLNSDSDPAETARHIWRAFDGITSRSRIREMFAPHSDRYFKMNPVAMLRHGTIEFRHPAGTASATEAAEFLDFYFHWARFTFNLERIWKPFQEDSFEVRYDKMFYRLPARVRKAMNKRRAIMATR
jgi:hypothetical protein